MQRNIAQLHPWLARLFLAGLVVQFYLAGAPLFGVTSFQPHRMLGGALTILAILIPILALAGRLERRLVGLSFLLLLLTMVQAILPSLRSSVPLIASLHPINALVLMGLSARISRSGRVEVLQVNRMANATESESR